MPDSNLVLAPAAPHDAPLLANLLELYMHDLSDVFKLDLGPDGRFGYAKLPLYFSEPGKRMPFLMRSAGQLVGFALVTRGSPVSEDPNVLDMAEFFVVRRHRRAGIGARAAALLWNRYPASWIVRVSAGNAAGREFWIRTLARYSSNSFNQTQRAGTPHGWHVFELNTSSIARRDS
jgi:predicted acetyltransferase